MTFWFNYVLLMAFIVAGGNSIVAYFLYRKRSGRRALGGFLLGVFGTLFVMPAMWGGGFPVKGDTWRLMMMGGILLSSILIFWGYVGEQHRS